MTDGASAGSSPDGRSVLATYRDDGRTWLLSPDGSVKEIVVENGETITWQRLGIPGS
jgi:hypothetical protein